MLTVKDVRATPYPADFPVISTPGNFQGWCLTVELDDKSVHNVVINRFDSMETIVAKLKHLAGGLEACQASQTISESQT
jgi:hypothetical protein